MYEMVIYGVSFDLVGKQPIVLLKTSEKQTLPVVLTHFIGAEGVADLGPLAAAAFLATLPSLVVFAIVQRRITGGMLTGAVKT